MPDPKEPIPEEYARFQALLRKVVKPDPIPPKPEHTADAVPDATKAV